MERLVVSLTRDGGRLGCTIRPDNTISTVFEGTPAARAGLRRGDLVLAVNGAPVPPDNGAFLALREPIAQLELAVARRAAPPPGGAPGPTRRRAAPAALGAERRDAKRRKTPPSPSPASAARREGSPAAASRPAARREEAAGGAAAAEDAAEVRREAQRLELILESRAVDVKADILARVRARDAAALALLSQLYPRTRKLPACVFCDEFFVQGARGTCKVSCEMKWSEEYTPTAREGLGTISGRCKRCGYLAEGVLCTEDGAINFPPRLCYEGPHRSEESSLACLRIQILGEAEHARHFGE